MFKKLINHSSNERENYLKLSTFRWEVKYIRLDALAFGRMYSVYTEAEELYNRYCSSLNVISMHADYVPYLNLHIIKIWMARKGWLKLS